MLPTTADHETERELQFGRGIRIFAYVHGQPASRPVATLDYTAIAAPARARIPDASKAKMHDQLADFLYMYSATSQDDCVRDAKLTYPGRSNTCSCMQFFSFLPVSFRQGKILLDLQIDTFLKQI